MIGIGLKYAWGKTKGCRLRHRISELIWEIRYAWQRAWKDYDETDIFAMNDRFIERYKIILQEYRNTHWGLFNIPDKYKDMFNNRKYFTQDETDTIIDTMIFHLSMCDEDYVEKKLFGKNIYDDDYNCKERTIEDHKRIFSIMDQNKEAFMKLFNDFFWDLWD